MNENKNPIIPNINLRCSSEKNENVDAPTTAPIAAKGTINFNVLKSNSLRNLKAEMKSEKINIGKRIAIVLDNFVYSAPTVQGEIPNGNSSISGNFTIEEAQDLANILKAGALPAPTTIVEDVVIGPTLGRSARAQGINSMMAGLAIVILFMIFYYSKGGLIANIALFLNIFFILGILAQLNASLTLPGVAGIVLTIGMSIDANVLIFSRIKEELRAGLGPQEAIKEGFSRAFTTIFDANITTLIAALVLYAIGTGPIKGFAITLSIGIVTSMFTAIMGTRAVVNLIYGNKNIMELKV